jgi:hypothetical protein
LEKPRTISQISEIFNLPSDFFFRNNVIDKAIKKDILKSEKFGKEVYYYSIFSDEFWDYFRKFHYKEIKKKEYVRAIEKDIKKLNNLLDSYGFRSIWNERVISKFKLQDFKDKNFLLMVLIVALYLVSIVIDLLERIEEIDLGEAGADTLYFERKIHPDIPPSIDEAFGEMILFALSPLTLLQLKPFRKTQYYKILSNIVEKKNFKM